MLRRKYGKEADIWSSGVILYILLCGVPPFYGETEQQIFDSILKGRLDLSSDPWPRISQDAKDCVRSMLTQVRQMAASPEEGLTDFKMTRPACEHLLPSHHCPLWRADMLAKSGSDQSTQL